jgi:hypothetical protein
MHFTHFRSACGNVSIYGDLIWYKSAALRRQTSVYVPVALKMTGIDWKGLPNHTTTNGLTHSSERIKFPFADVLPKCTRLAASRSALLSNSYVHLKRTVRWQLWLRTNSEVTYPLKMWPKSSDAFERHCRAKPASMKKIRAKYNSGNSRYLAV